MTRIMAGFEQLSLDPPRIFASSKNPARDVTPMCGAQRLRRSSTVNAPSITNSLTTLLRNLRLIDYNK